MNADLEGSDAKGRTCSAGLQKETGEPHGARAARSARSLIGRSKRSTRAARTSTLRRTETFTRAGSCRARSDIDACGASTPGVTLELLHLEYLRAHPDGYRYTAFGDVYRRWRERGGLVMRQQHKAGDRALVDDSGKRAAVIDPSTGEVVDVEPFVAVLGASNLTYVEVTRTQTVMVQPDRGRHLSHRHRASCAGDRPQG